MARKRKAGKKKAKKSRRRKPGKKLVGKKVAKSQPTARKELSEKELIELLSPRREFDLKIWKTFEEMPKKFCIMLVEKLSEYGVLNTRLVKYFVDKKMKGIYVTINKNLADLIENFNAEGIPTDNIIFIDAISRMIGDNEIRGSNFYYLDSPRDMVELSVALEKAISKIGDEERFVIIDSLTTLLVYNKEKIVEKLVHSISGKIRAWNAKGIFILMESTKKETTNTLAQFCDRVITL